jgi:REP element-mobilizing transposase RayT
MSRLDYSLFSERNLPHFQPGGADFFVTFRLANSIPEEQYRYLKALRNQYTNQLNQITDPNEKDSASFRFDKLIFKSWDDILHKYQCGDLWLKEDRIANIVAESLHWGDGREYNLRCFCIMSNHVHTALKPIQSVDGEPFSLSRIMHSIKRYTAQQANLVLGRIGDFWQHESYDHAIRDDREYHNILNYIVMNPVNAGLVPQWSDWRWTYVQDGLM